MKIFPARWDSENFRQKREKCIFFWNAQKSCFQKKIFSLFRRALGLVEKVKNNFFLKTWFLGGSDKINFSLFWRKFFFFQSPKGLLGSLITCRQCIKRVKMDLLWGGISTMSTGWRTWIGWIWLMEGHGGPMWGQGSPMGIVEVHWYFSGEMTNEMMNTLRKKKWPSFMKKREFPLPPLFLSLSLSLSL